MATPYISQIVPFACNFAPRNFAFCSGQLLPISQNTALFSLVGTIYGGNGVTTFALPDLRGRVPIHFGQGPGLSNYVQGQLSGTEATTLQSGNLPAHTHTATFANNGSALNAATIDSTLKTPAAGLVFGRIVDTATPTNVPRVYAPAGTATPVALGGLNVAGTVTVNPTGSSQPISIVQPYLAINFCIAISGVFPSRN